MAVRPIQKLAQPSKGDSAVIEITTKSRHLMFHVSNGELAYMKLMATNVPEIFHVTDMEQICKVISEITPDDFETEYHKGIADCRLAELEKIMF